MRQGMWIVLGFRWIKNESCKLGCDNFRFSEMAEMGRGFNRSVVISSKFVELIGRMKIKNGDDFHHFDRAY